MASPDHREDCLGQDRTQQAVDVNLWPVSGVYEIVGRSVYVPLTPGLMSVSVGDLGNISDMILT
jgi:hypothetical protein